MDGPVRLIRRLRADPRRAVVVDAAAILALGLVLIPLGMTGVIDPGWPTPPALSNPWWHALTLGLGCLALLLKRRRPVTTVALVVPVVAADAAIGGSIGAYVVLIDALYSLVLHTRDTWVRPALLSVGAVVVLAPAATFVATGDTRSAAFVLLQVFAFLGTPIWWGLSVRQQSRLARLAGQRAEDLQRLAGLQRDRAVRDERNRMAQDLHDALSSNLSTIAIHSSAALSARATPRTPVGAGDVAPRPEAAPDDPSLREIRAASVRALGDLREMILLLQTGQDPITPPAHLADIGPLLATARGTGLRVTLDGDPAGLPSLPSVVDQAGYRIVQESLANAVKHAPGSDVRVRLDARADALHLSVSSTDAATSAAGAPGPNGHVPDDLEGSGLGLRTMQARASTLGGTLDAGWQPTAGGPAWVVRAVLPLAQGGTP